MTDKLEAGLLNFYNDLFKPLKEANINLLELGILNGESLEYWQDYFPKGKFVGFDYYMINNPKLSPRVTLYKGKQDDSFALRDLGNTLGPFNIIIDDCSHYGLYTQISFDFLFEHLSPNGYYIIEDWTAGFRSAQFRGIDEVLGICIKNFENYKIKEIRALRLSEGGSISIIQKI
jgi:hypothetical protein